MHFCYLVQYLQTKIKNIQEKLGISTKNEIKSNKKIEMTNLDWVIAHDLKTRIQYIQTKNKDYLMKKYYIPYFKRMSKDVDGCIIDDSIAFCQANHKMMRDLTTGMIDELYTENSYIEGIRKVNEWAREGNKND